MIKKALESLAKIAAGNKVLWQMTMPFQYFSNHLQHQRRLLEQAAPKKNPHAEQIEKTLGQPVVKNGPFKGLKYPSYFSVGSAIYPKILGSYEAELHPVFEYELRQQYDEIYDIGCAEGYYAVGLAMHLPGARIKAYDIDERAGTFCRAMAEFNQVADRVEIHSAFDRSMFRSFRPESRILFICDCEGYERELFTPEILPFLKDVTLLIETHDFIHPGTSEQIEQLLRETHDVRVIQSTDDLIKTKTYHYKEIENADFTLKKLILQEQRPHIMEWIYATPGKAETERIEENYE